MIFQITTTINRQFGTNLSFHFKKKLLVNYFGLNNTSFLYNLEQKERPYVAKLFICSAEKQSAADFF